MSIEFGLGSDVLWLRMTMVDQQGDPVVLPLGTVVSLTVTVVATNVVIAGEVVNGDAGLCRFLMTSAVLGVVGNHSARIKAVYPSAGPKPVSRQFTITVG